MVSIPTDAIGAEGQVEQCERHIRVHDSFKQQAHASRRSDSSVLADDIFWLGLPRHLSEPPVHNHIPCLDCLQAAKTWPSSPVSPIVDSAPVGVARARHGFNGRAWGGGWVSVVLFTGPSLVQEASIIPVHVFYSHPSSYSLQPASDYS